MYRLIREHHRALLPHLNAFARDLIRIPSESLHEEAAALRVETEMKSLGFDRVFRDEAGNVVGIMTGREPHPVLLLASHLDTVGAAGEAWKQDPFAGRVEDGRLTGLGAADCKSGLAAQTYAAGLLHHCMLPLQGTIVVAATVAEENGCSLGLRHLLKHTLPDLGLMPDYAVIGEPTGNGLYYGHDGWVELDIQVEGSDPFLVDDAADSISGEMNQDRGLGRKLGTDMEMDAPRFEEVEGFRRATFRMVRRLAEAENEEEVAHHLQHEMMLAASGGGVAVDVKVRHVTQHLYTGKTEVVRRVTHAWCTDPCHPLIERSRQALTAAGLSAKPGKWRLGRLGMGTSGGVLCSKFQVPVIGYGPGEEEQAHAADESVTLAAMADCMLGTALIAHGLTGIPVFGWTADEI